MPNFEAGARTPLAAVFSAVLLLGLVSPARRCSPHPARGIAGLLLLTAWSLVDLAGWRRLWTASRYDFGVASAT